MQSKISVFTACVIIIFTWSCDKDVDIKNIGTVLPQSKQRVGDADKGREYLINGDYLSSGIPLETYKLLFPSDQDDLARQGINKGINYQFTTVKHPNGASIVAQNCLTCHATKIDNKIIVGLGNNLSNYTVSQQSLITTLESIVKFQYGEKSKEYEAFQPFLRATKTIGPDITTPSFGLNPANNIFAILAAHRDKNTLAWMDVAVNKPSYVIPTDVPAWWIMKKKNALYYNGLGEGDFGTLMMTSSLLTMKDKSEAETINEKFADVVAFINSIDAPKYPYTIDEQLAEKGRKIFIDKCSSCHGTYGTVSTYPNLLVNLEEIDTDHALAKGYKSNPQYHEWFNQSWFANNKYPAYLRPKDGYVAPPLDGIWATAPYFHNGSVPTLKDVLDSSQRPIFWKRTSLINDQYDKDLLGWKYVEEKNKVDENVYDTTSPGMNNKGHYYGDKLSQSQRKALLEYLKKI